MHGPHPARRTFPILALAALLSGCVAGSPRSTSHEMLNAVLWQRTSAEYAALTRQVYATARRSLDQALADRNWTAALEQTGNFTDRPPAIIIDLDETALDNTGYEIRLIREYGRFTPETFASWCQEARASAIPGVRDFLNDAIERGVTVIYYSSRPESLRACTKLSIRHAGLPVPDDAHLLLNDGRSKSDYRRAVADGYRILLLVGDNLEDFMAGSKAPSEARSDLAMRHADRWGRQWILLPNSMYGHWEASFYQFNYGLTREEQLMQKIQALEIGRAFPTQE